MCVCARQVNDSFQELADLLQVKRKTKSDKVTVLHAALDEVRVRRRPPWSCARVLVCAGACVHARWW